MGGGMSMARYAWVITRDHLDGVDVDITGPRRATDGEVATARNSGIPFKLYDDDGELYYSGKCWVADECAGHPAGQFDTPGVTMYCDGSCDTGGGFRDEHLGPLDDFGAPDSGCTYIRYRLPGGTWETL